MSVFINRLINETSPYLLQHSHNPVEWYAWGDEALQKAKEQDKPILISIGYSACHWCHVMEKESFEDEATANLMNKLFINIKIDREERPDLDHIYMDAVQAIAGSGGWPLNVFLTPDRKPFYGGTYFPPIKAFNRLSWKEVLINVSNLFAEKRLEVEAQAEELIQHIAHTNAFVQPQKIFDGENEFDRKKLNYVFENIMQQADKKWGGFGRAPKFPQTFTINYLLRHYHFTNNRQALDQACLSLDKMIDGGIYDQVGGGFSRYSTDVEWLAPHFEKMLYDNALIISTLSEAYQLTHEEKYQYVVDATIKFIKKELTNEEGGFYSALDADSEGEEGKYYVWSFEEIHRELQKDAKIFCDFYDVSPQGNWEHKNILRVLTPISIFAIKINMEIKELQYLLNDCRGKLLKCRSLRIRPSLDDKIILGWNALMITALCKAFNAFSNDEFRDIAIKNMHFLWKNLTVSKNSGEFRHTFKNNIAKFPAFLDDYTYLIQACIHLQEITSDVTYLEKAKSLAEHVIANFSDQENLYFFYTGKQQNDVILRKKEIYDGAMPSGNSVMCANLFYLSIIFDNITWRVRAVNMLNNMESMVIKYPTSFGNLACELAIQVYNINEIVIVGNKSEKMRDDLLTYFIPNKVLQIITESNEHYPLLQNKKVTDQTLIYLCKEYACQAPVNTIKELINQMT